MDTCVRYEPHSGANHEWAVKTEYMDTKIVLCNGHATEFNLPAQFPLPTPCNCRICNP